MGKAIDLTGLSFGKLTVIDRNYNYVKEKGIKYPVVYWNCHCECGKNTVVSGINLRSGKVFSCGCLRKEKTYRNLTGKIFNKLTVLEETEEREGSSIKWLCRCNCGNLVKVSSSSLVSGNTQSCGCLNSKGEEQICKILRENNIVFEQQKTFLDCRTSPKNPPLRFDFYINNSFLLEFDGRQHFSSDSSGWNTEELFEKTVTRDRIKNDYCKKHNIPLKRIPYWRLKTLTIEQIMDDTFLQKEE